MTRPRICGVALLPSTITRPLRGTGTFPPMSRVDSPVLPAAQTPEAPRPAPGRRVIAWLGFLAVAASAVVGSNMFAVRDHLLGTATPAAAPPAAGRAATGSPGDTVAAAPAASTSLRSSPWWQDVTTLEGTGASSPSITIAGGALQWRVQWTCSTGRLVVRASKQAKAVVDGACPQGAEGYSVQKGQQALQVTADGPWKLTIAQQVDVPLVEPPSPAMTAPGARVAGTGSFYNIDKTGTGKATLYRQADGRYAVRLEDFFVSPNTDLELRLSSVEAPHSSEEFANAPSDLITVMDVTAGSVNYTLPATVDPTKYKSVVVWCVPIKSAYAAATLGGAR
jgi:hypothetical protein